MNSIVLGYSSAQIGAQGLFDDKTGLIYIASLLRGTALDDGHQVYAQEQFFRVYAHEFGNRLSWLYTGNGASFGTSGIQGQAVEEPLGPQHQRGQRYRCAARKVYLGKFESIMGER